LNIENTEEFISYLLSNNIIGEEETVQITRLKGGVSNRTLKVDFGIQSWVVKQALNKLRVSGDWFSAPERIFHEAATMRWLHQNLPGTSPELIFEDQANYLLAMQAIPAPFINLKSHLLTEQPELIFLQQAGTMLGRIHQLGKDAQQLPELLLNTNFFNSLRVRPYYQQVIRTIPKTEAFFNKLIKETRIHGYTLTHGDFSPKNLLVKDEQLILLDHEVAHYGDGTFDIGFFITHLLAKSIYRPKLRDLFHQGIERFVVGYKEETHLDIPKEQRAVAHTIGCLLARVCGLSPLEYLDPTQQQLQKLVALKLLEHPPKHLNALTSAFKSNINDQN
jgi:5-methylthioribose kinase